MPQKFSCLLPAVIVTLTVTTGVSQEETQNKQPKGKYEAASFLEHGSQESAMLASQLMSLSNNTTQSIEVTTYCKRYQG